jgi:hypothetical protein
MTLYYLGTLTVFGRPENPRVSAMVRRVSTDVRIGNQTVWSATRYLELPETRTPKLWLTESLEDWLELTGR